MECVRPRAQEGEYCLLSHRERREGVNASASKHVGGAQGVDSFPLGSVFLSSGVDTSELRGGREMTR